MAVFDNLNKTYSSGVSPSVIQYYERKAQLNIQPMLVHLRDAQMQTLPMNNGRVVNFHRFVPLEAVTTPLSEGVTPAGQNLTETAFSVLLKSYGGHIEITDEMDMYLLNNMTVEASNQLNDQAALSLDTIAREALNAGLNVQYVNSVSNTTRATLAATDKLTYAEIKKAVRTLDRQNIKPFSDGYYHAIVHPDVKYDLTSDVMWVDVAKYQDKTKVEQNEMGIIYKVKFYQSTNAKIFGAQTYIFGTTTDIAASATWDSATREMTYSVSLSEDDARNLTGRLVNAQYTDAAVNYVTPMCVESVNTTTKKIKFRWQPASSVYANWTVAKSFKIVPTGGGASGVSVYSTLIYGQDAFGTVKLANNGNVKIDVYPPGGRDDPHGQRGMIAWTVKGFCAAILDNNAIVRIESGATA